MKAAEGREDKEAVCSKCVSVRQSYIPAFLSPCSMLLKFLEHEIPVPAAPAVKAHTFSLTTLNLISERERPQTTCPEKAIAPTARQTVTSFQISQEGRSWFGLSVLMDF